MKSKLSQQVIDQISSLEAAIEQELKEEIDATRKNKHTEGIKKDSNDILVPVESDNEEQEEQEDEGEGEVS